MSRRGQDDDHLPASEAGDATPENDRGEADTGRAASEPDAPDEDPEGEAAQSWPGRDFGSIPPPG